MNKAIIAILALTLATVLAGLGFYTYTHSTSPISARSSIPNAVVDLWTQWKDANNKKYGTQDQARLKIFYQNYQKVMTHQSDPSKTYSMGFTKFMDLTPEEFKAIYLTAARKTNAKRIFSKASVPSVKAAAASVDWKDKGAVTGIKDQGQCGSCWAFGTVGALESLSFISGQGLKIFSEQQLVDCSTSYGNDGCNGGLGEQAFHYVQDNGITEESDYPYEAVDQSCQTEGGAFKISGYVSVPHSDVDELAVAVTQQPIDIAVDAENWQLYSGGVFDDCGTNLDHEVLLVGYTADYWIVKNSWSESWGEEGYIRLARGNTCGLADDAYYPTA